MENKKLLKYLLKDLSELEEMFTESSKNSFDEMEMEFIKNRISGAKRLVKLFLEKEETAKEETADIPVQQKAEAKKTVFNNDKTENKSEVIIKDIASEVQAEVIEEKVPEVVVQESYVENQAEEELPETNVEEKTVEVDAGINESDSIEKKELEVKEQLEKDIAGKETDLKQESNQKEVHLEDEEQIDVHNKRLGDSFLKEKSVNDIMSDDLSKLEHKLSNRPVASIKSAIGINDRFQYIRELFEGSADNFVKAVADLDSMEDIKEAVDYLQTNFKWKKNDTSLKFISLIKRRFPNE